MAPSTAVLKRFEEISKQYISYHVILTSLILDVKCLLKNTQYITVNKNFL